jgi:hemerythrin
MLLDLDALPSVEMEFMNEVHKEDVEIINTLFETLLAYENEPNKENASRVDTIFEKWVAHTVSHFEGEEVKMREMGFPPYAMHKGEHDRTLAQMRMFLKEWKETREVKPLKIYLVEELPAWLSNHILTMDTVTATFFKTGISPCSI